MRIWIDAQLSPSLAAWINRTFDGIKAESVRAVGLRDALDQDIFKEAREQQVVVMSKDNDFISLIEEQGPPPKLIWITCGNTSNATMREILGHTLVKAKNLLEQGENIVEISDKTVAG
jgi:predicted nuclease of predicted toxin-antitoxin system